LPLTGNQRAAHGFRVGGRAHGSRRAHRCEVLGRRRRAGLDAQPGEPEPPGPDSRDDTVPDRDERVVESRWISSQFTRTR